MGDVLVRVNNQQLTLLKHSKVVEVLRGLLRSQGSQLVLLRFQYAEGSQVQRQDKVDLPSQIPPSQKVTALPHQQSTASTGYAAPPSYDLKDDAFRSESWHGPRVADGGKGTPHARSVSPPHSGGRSGGGDGRLGATDGVGSNAALSRSGSSGVKRHSFGGAEDRGEEHSIRRSSAGGSSSLTINGAGRMKRSRSGDQLGLGQGRLRPNIPEKHDGGNVTLDATAGGAPSGAASLMSGEGLGGLGGRGKVTRRGELWGEHGKVGSAGDAGSRQLYLGDMGHAKAQKTLGHIAQDVQVRHEMLVISSIDVGWARDCTLWMLSLAS